VGFQAISDRVRLRKPTILVSDGDILQLKLDDYPNELVQIVVSTV
jgi:hypothetical protein